MVTAGIIVMALMMGAMFFGGHGMKHKHSGHQEHAPAGIAVSSSTSTTAPAAPAEEAKDTEHAQQLFADNVELLKEKEHGRK